MIRQRLLSLTLFAFVCASAIPGLAEVDSSVDLVIDFNTGLTWVADSHYAVRSGISRNIVMPRYKALDFIDAMNDGEIENFGYPDWRLANHEELRRLLRLGTAFGDLTELELYLAGTAARDPDAISARVKFGDDLVYPWPVRGVVAPAGFGNIVAFAIDRMVLKKRVRVLTGSIVVNDSFGELRIDENVTTHSLDSNPSFSIKANDIEIKTGSVINSDVFYNVLVNNGVINGTLTNSFSPPFGLLPAFKTGTPGTSKIEVQSDETFYLPPGAYQEIKVKKRGILRFDGGVYEVLKIETEDDATLLFEAPTQVLVQDKVKTNQRAIIGPSSPSIGARDIIFYIEGDGSHEFGEDSQIRANFYVPVGKLKFKQRVNATGAFVAREFETTEDGRLNLDSYFLNRAPVAVDDVFTLDEGGTVDTTGGVSILDNDFDPNPDSTITLTPGSPGHLEVNTTSNGLLTLNPDGTFVYTHDGGESAGDSFTYLICDDGEPVLCDEGFVSFSINNVNDPPVADSQTVQFSGTAPVNITLTGSDAESDDLLFALVGGLANGNGSLSALVEDPPPSPGVPPGCAPGECTVDPDPPRTSATVVYTPNNEGPNSFIFEVDDQNGGTAIATVLINPEEGENPDGGDPPPDPPGNSQIVANDIFVETTRDTPVTITLKGEAPAAVDLTFAIVPMTGPSFGVLSPVTDGTGSPQRVASVTYTPNLGSLAADSFDFEACDQAIPTNCDTATLSISVIQPVPLTEDQEVEGEAGGSTVITLIGNSGGEGNQAPQAFITPRKFQKVPYLAVGIAEATAIGTVLDSDLNGTGDALINVPVPTTEDLNGLIPDDPSNPAETGHDQVIELTGISIGERFQGQSNTPTGDFDILGTTASGPLTLLAGASGQNLFVVEEADAPGSIPPGFGNVVAGLGPQGSPNFDAIGEGAVSVLFDDDQSTFSFDVVGQGGGDADLVVFARDGSTIEVVTVLLSSMGPETVTYQAPPGAAGIAGFSFFNANGGGVGLDNFSFDIAGPLAAALSATDETRIQIEWVLPGFTSADLDSASVTVYTEVGPNDDSDTEFRYGSAEQDGSITPSDFEAPTAALQSGVMPAPTDPVGTPGSFNFDVLNAIQNVKDPESPIAVFSIQGRVNSIGQGLQVLRSPLPTLQFSTPPPVFVPPILFTVVSLPPASFGTLLDSNGFPVVTGQVLPSQNLTFLGNGVTGVTSFSFEAEQAGTISVGQVSIVLVDTCAEQGRPPGCTPN